MSGDKKSYKVFISSTYLDNAERRRIVEDAVVRADMGPLGMERFTASAHPTVEECQRYARDCDIYVGIIAHRYGWIPDGRQVSITELEYDAAKEAARPRLLFEIDGSVPVDMQKDFDPLPDRWDKQKTLDDFKAKYRRDQMPTPFTDTMLGAKVLHALNLWRDQHEGRRPAADGRKPDDGAVSGGCYIEAYPPPRSYIASKREPMGITHVTVSVANLKQDQPPYEADFLVDIGAIDCLAPASSLAAAGIEVEGRDVYELANGEVVEYPFGFARVSGQRDRRVDSLRPGGMRADPRHGGLGEYRHRSGPRIAQPRTNDGQAFEVQTRRSSIRTARSQIRLPMGV